MSTFPSLPIQVGEPLFFPHLLAQNENVFLRASCLTEVRVRGRCKGGSSMPIRYTQPKPTLNALLRVRKPLPPPSRVKGSKKRYSRAREQRSIAAEIRAA